MAYGIKGFFHVEGSCPNSGAPFCSLFRELPQNVDVVIAAPTSSHPVLLLWLVQLKAIGVTLLLVIPVTLVVTLTVRLIAGLRPGGEIESQGLDIHDHGEEGYTLNG